MQFCQEKEKIPGLKIKKKIVCLYMKRVTNYIEKSAHTFVDVKYFNFFYSGKETFYIALVY